MKVRSSIFSFLAGGMVCLLAWFLISSSDSVSELDKRPVVLAMVASPQIPEALPFCGKMIDISRYNMREGYDRELTSFTYFHSTTLLYFKRANRYFPIIEPILKENGIPDDFKYLAVIESNLDPRITSPARAVGMWQLMETTARKYGLTVTPTVDERCDVEKSTEAACKYLKDAYAKYGDWLAAASSYNAGMGRISGELDRQEADTTLDLWLAEETSRYVYRIMAIKQIFSNPYKYGFVIKPENLYKPIESKIVQTSDNIDDLSAFARKHGITYADLKRFNPWLRDRKLVTGGKSFSFIIPKEKDLFYRHSNVAVHDPRWVAN